MKKYYAYHPPSRHHSTTHVSYSGALSRISTYLAAAGTDTSLHPDAFLTKAGPRTRWNAGLVLHNLKRVEAGLRGEYLGPEIWFQESKNRRERKQSDVEGSVKSKEGAAEEEWQDRGEFERAQEVEAGDIGDSGAEAAKDNAGAVPVLKVPDGGLGKEDWRWMEKPDMENTKREKAEEIEKVKHEFRNLSVMKAPSDTLSKEERKRRKKARREDEKREKAAKQRKRPREVTVEPMDLDP